MTVLTVKLAAGAGEAWRPGQDCDLVQGRTDRADRLTVPQIRAAVGCRCLWAIYTAAAGLAVKTFERL